MRNGDVLPRGVVLAIDVAFLPVLAWALLPPMEYLPTGNRNLVFGILVPPPGYSIEELEATGNRLQTLTARRYFGLPGVRLGSARPSARVTASVPISRR